MYWCIGFSESYINLINHSGFSWICYRCGSNFDIPISGSGLFTLSTSFTTLDDSLSNSTTVNQDNVHTKSSTSIGVSTERQYKKLGSHKNCQKHIKCMIINCNCLKSESKKTYFCESIAHHNPYIICDCESKISNDIATYSIFPENYSVHRKERNSKGGVFIAIKEFWCACVSNGRYLIL